MISTKINLTGVLVLVLLPVLGIGQQFLPSYSLEVEQEEYEPLSAPVILNPGIDSPGHDNYTLPLGFEFQFFGESLHSLRVTRSGIVFFGTDAEFIAPFFPEAELVSTSAVGYELWTEGPCQRQIMIIEWKDLSLVCPDNRGGRTVSFQLWLYEEDSRLELRYGPQSKIPTDGCTSNRYSRSGPRLRVSESEQMAIVMGTIDTPFLVQDEETLIEVFDQKSLEIPPIGTVYRFLPTKDPVTTDLPFLISPNPTDTLLRIQIISPVCGAYRMTFSDLLDRVYFFAESEDPDLYLDLIDYDPGLYLIRMEWEEEVVGVKVLVQ